MPPQCSFFYHMRTVLPQAPFCVLHGIVDLCGTKPPFFFAKLYFCYLPKPVIGISGGCRAVRARFQCAVEVIDARSRGGLSILAVVFLYGSVKLCICKNESSVINHFKRTQKQQRRPVKRKSRAAIFAATSKKVQFQALFTPLIKKQGPRYCINASVLICVINGFEIL